MLETSIEDRLKHAFGRAPVHDIQGSDRYVVVSDLHMGDGSYHDDFRRTSNLFKGVFENYYLEKGFNLILNGDVEELYKFMLRKIMERWNSIYELFGRFKDELSLFKLNGNHDHFFHFLQEATNVSKQIESLRLRFHEAELFFLHGHQSSHWLERLHGLQTVLIRGVVNPLRLKNWSLDLGRKGVTKKENRLSEFSLKNKVVTFMGHTHRPLFGTDSRTPLLYNSGAAIGRKGITTLEIDRGRLNLVHWWDRKVVKRY
ncbi:MAG: hypothetical protein ACMUHM_04075, partial [Thermoplasmatota archaeon]